MDLNLLISVMVGLGLYRYSMVFLDASTVPWSKVMLKEPLCPEVAGDVVHTASVSDIL